MDTYSQPTPRGLSVPAASATLTCAAAVRTTSLGVSPDMASADIGFAAAAADIAGKIWMYATEIMHVYCALLDTADITGDFCCIHPDITCNVSCDVSCM